MRVPVPLILSVLLLAAAAGEEQQQGEPVAADAASVISPSPTRTPSSPTPEPTALDGFSLALGYDAENGDDHSPVRITGRPAMQRFELCGVVAWDPRPGTSAVRGVEWRGEAEWSRGRTLVLYPSEAAATAAVAASRTAVSRCPEDSRTHTLVDVVLGEESVVWTDTYWSVIGGEKLYDTGLTVYHLVRVGRAVLLAYEYGEGNGSVESRAGAVQRATDLERPVVAEMVAVG